MKRFSLLLQLTVVLSEEIGLYERIYEQTQCQHIMWNGERIPFAIVADNTQFSNENILLKYEEKREELSLKKCMRKCFRYAGCVAWNFYENDASDICELYSSIGKVVPSNHPKATRGYYSEFCEEVENFYDFRMKRRVSIVFQKITEFLDDDVRKNLMRTVLTVNGLKPDNNRQWNFTVLHNKHDRDYATSERYIFEVREYQEGPHTMCTFNFDVDRIVRIKSASDYSKDIEDFFGSDDIFIANLFKITWPENIKLYDIDAQPSEIRILTPKEFYGIQGRVRGDEDGICSAIDGTLDCDCAPGLIYENGSCRDINECEAEGPLRAGCSRKEECYNFRGSYSCIQYPIAETFTDTAAQRIAVLVARLKNNRVNFDYSKWLLKLVSMLEEVRDVPDENGEPRTCTNPFDLDTGKDIKKIARTPNIDEWFQLIYKRTYWVFKNCPNGSKHYLRTIKKMYRGTVPRAGHHDIFETMTEEYLESEFSPEYDSANYDDYFDVRREKIEDGLIAEPKQDDQHDAARSEFETIDWSWIEKEDYDNDFYPLWAK